MNDFKKLTDKLVPVFSKAAKHLHFIFIILLLCCCVFLVYKIDTYAGTAPSDDEVAAESKTLPRPRVDQTALDQLMSLEDMNIEVNTIFKEARNNPFSE